MKFTPPFKGYSALFALVLLGHTLCAQPFDWLPAPVGANQVLTYTQFTLSYNEEHEQPDWVAYELTAEESEAQLSRCDCFAADRSVTTGSASLNDYKNSGFDRGHLSPAADNNMSDQANRESFLLSNMSPQLSSFNSGIWAELEEWVRVQALHYDTVWVVTGPVFHNSLRTIGANKVTVPGYFYKVLLRREAGKYYAIGFLMPHFYSIGTLKDFAVKVDLIESLTGLDFFPALPDSIENSEESRLSFRRWQF
jgi:endonuclease G